jgi:HK97 gp10 family phage protein
MASVKGKQEMNAFFANLPGKLQENVLRGAMRAAAKVVADEAKENCISEDVRKSIKISSRAHDDGRVVAKVKTAGKGAFMAPWLEFGTSEHYISVDDSQRQGMSIGRINRKAKEGVLVINGEPVGKTVLHPGARPHPFLRPALDLKGDEAIRAAQAHIDKRLAKEGYNTPDLDDAED